MIDAADRVWHKNIMMMNTGLSEAERKKIAEGLSKFLADTYTLYLKTHNFHWNVTGPHFQSLHLMWEAQYQDLAIAVDDIAERIRALGFKAPGSYTEFAKLTSLAESHGNVSWEEMTRQLVEGNEAIVRSAKEVFTVADEAHDESSADLLNNRSRYHEKTAWMLRSLLEK